MESYSSRSDQNQLPRYGNRVRNSRNVFELIFILYVKEDRQEIG